MHKQAKPVKRWLSEKTKENEMATKKQTIVINSLISKAEQLATQHEQFTEQYVTRANDELYLLLGEMLTVCEQVEASGIKDNIVKQMRKTLREKYSIKTQSNSRTTSIVVRYVVRSNRKTAHVYGRVIEAAIADGITAEKLADYIRNKGGIEKIRKAAVTQATEHAADVHKKNLRALTEMTLKAAALKPITTLQLKAESSSLWHDNYTEHGVRFEYFICVSGYGKPGHNIVAPIPPSQKLEEIALNQLNTVMVDDLDVRKKTTLEYCLEMGASTEMIAREMTRSGVYSEDEIAEFTKNTECVDRAEMLKIAA